MMIILVSKIVFVLSVLGILFMIGRKISALSGLPEESFVQRFSFAGIFRQFGKALRRLISNDFFQNVLLANLEKSLRKFKIAALKIDNIIDKCIRKLKRNSNRGEETPR